MDKEYHARKSREHYSRITKEEHKIRNAYRAEKRRENKRKAVAFMGGKCQECGDSLPDCCFDFHHKDPTVTNEVPSSVLHCSWKRILEELEKCLMVCANCHRIIHNEDGYIAHTKRAN